MYMSRACIHAPIRHSQIYNDRKTINQPIFCACTSLWPTQSTNPPLVSEVSRSLSPAAGSFPFELPKQGPKLCCYSSMRP